MTAPATCNHHPSWINDGRCALCAVENMQLEAGERAYGIRTRLTRHGSDTREGSRLIRERTRR